MNAWRSLQQFTGILGNRILVISSSETSSKELANRALFEMQKAKKQVVLSTVTTKFPTQKSIEDSVSLFLRSGCSSIITIGSASITDFGKGVRRELQSRTSISLRKYPLDMLDYGFMYTARNNHVPLIAMARSVSPAHYLNSMTYLHSDEDAFLYRHCSAPEVVVNDVDLLEDLDPLVTKWYLNSYLFDCAYSSSLKSEKARMSSHSLPGHDAIASLPMAIAQLRMTIGTPSVDEDHPLLNAEHWPGIIESMGLLTTLHHSTVQSSRQGPYSWHCVRALFQLLKLVQADSYADPKCSILKSIFNARAFLCCYLNISDHQLLDELELCNRHIEEMLKNSRHSQQKKPFISTVSSANLVQGMIVTEEAELTQRENILFGVDKNNNLLSSPSRVKLSSFKHRTLHSEVLEIVVDKLIQ